MAGIHVTLGRASQRGPLEVIYAGESASEAREAEAASVLPWVLRLDNPPVVRKHNVHAEANQAKANERLKQVLAEVGLDGPDGPDGQEVLAVAGKPRKK